MTLEAGRTLGHYEILGPLGAGGMGEVYRARDTRLEREVAIKVLPEELAGDPERLRRFEREAKTLAALNHPNVAHVHGIDRTGETSFIAMELVEGEDLAARLARGPLPLDDVIEVGRQIAEGLEAAHEAGVVHRDLKPANVRVTPEGRVKILDFGLAKPMMPEGRAGSTTAEGLVLGTPFYMAPEQVRGQPIDKRSDVWAFGCVLFECLTGRRAFDGETTGDALAAVLEKEPDLSLLPRRTPDSLRQVLERCLRKDPRRRLRDIGDVRLLIEDVSAAPPSASDPAATADVRLKRYQVLAATLGAVLLGAGILALKNAFDEDAGPAPGETNRWSLDLPAGAELGWRGTSANLSKLALGSPLLAISADGRRVAYCVDHGDGSEIHALDLGAEFTSRPVAGTEDARAPFLSSSGEWLGFFANEYLQIVSVDGGGAAQKVHRVSSPNFAACFTPDDDFIVFSTNAGLWRVRPNGEDLERLASPRRDRGEVEYASPSALPDGRGVLFTVSTGTESHVALLSLDTREVRLIVRDGTNAHLLPDGRFVYAQAGGIRLLAFDPTSGGAAPVSEPVQSDVFTTPCAGGWVMTHFAVSLDGTLVYAPDVSEPTRSIVYWVDFRGLPEKIDEGPGYLEHLRLSPDGRRFACDILDDRGVKDVYVYDFERRSYDRLTEDGTSVMSAWSPDGAVLVRSTSVQNAIRRIALPARSVEVLPSIPDDDVDAALFADCWSPDGKTLFLTRKGADGLSIWTYSEGAREPVARVTEKNARFGAISPDGKWLAYTATERGSAEVFIRPYPALDPPVQISIDGGAEPLWSKDGRRLFYRREAAMLSVSIETEPAFARGKPEVLFPAPNPFDWEPGGHLHYDLDPAGARFLMCEQRTSAPRRLHVVLNWTRELTPP